MSQARLRLLETAREMDQVVSLQRLVWPGSETGIVPAHLLLAAVHNGGLVIGACAHRAGREPSPSEPGAYPDPADRGEELAGFVFGFPGFYLTPDGPRLKHCSHMLGVHPQHRGQGMGFALKRAQWQMVRNQGIDRITWTFDPLHSHHAYLNIALLGGVSNTYLRDLYGQGRKGSVDESAADRLQIDWWVNTKRVERRLSSQPRLPLDLAHFLSAGVKILNPSEPGGIFLGPGPFFSLEPLPDERLGSGVRILLVEIPADIEALRAADPVLAQAWGIHIRKIFEILFEQGYLITDFIYLTGNPPRSFYVVSHGESTF